MKKLNTMAFLTVLMASTVFGGEFEPAHVALKAWGDPVSVPVQE